MTGPEHYTKAEQLLREQSRIISNHDGTNPAAALMIAEARVHATLALTAATALNPAGEDFIPEKNWPEYEAWARVCSVMPKAVSP